MQALPTPPHDQAEGLRRMFAHARARFVPLLANPYLSCPGALLERLTSACAELGLHALVVDAAEGASSIPRELAWLDLAEGIETLAPRTDYLAARGLPLRHVDAEGSTAGFLQAVADAAPRADVVWVHAGASELARLFMRRRARALLLADDRPEAVTHAYAGLKLLAQRAGLMTHDLLLAAAADSPRAERIAMQLARCSDEFVGAVLHDFARIDPTAPASDPTPARLRRFVCELLLANEPGALPSSAAPHAAAIERMPALAA